jgi:hypothetical protein
MCESDWKIFRQLREQSLDRFCAQVLSEIGTISTDTATSNHERYLAVFKHIMERDDELARAFNNPRRSAALLQLAAIKSLGLLSDEELSQFQRETRDSVRALLQD